MLRSLLLNGVALPLHAPEGEGAAGAEPKEGELPLDDATAAGGDDAGAAGGQGDDAGTGADAAGAGADDKAAAAAAEADKVAKDDANKAAAAKRKANAPKWAMDEITAQRAARRAAEEAAAAKDREIENLRQLAERAGTPGAKEGIAAPGTPQRTQYGSKEEFDRAVEVAATQREFAKSTQDIFDAGIKDFQDFQESLNIMTAVGATSDEFAADLVAVDKANAHKIIHELAQTPELSKRLAAMSSRQRVAELTKMSLKMQEDTGKGGTRQVSRAAAPLRALEGSAGSDTNDLGDNVPDDVWSARFDKKYGLNGAQQ
jgi:hypothetical protein